jgi:hypothetical protein
MKTKLTLLSLMIAVSLCSFMWTPAEVTRFDGVWQLKEYNYGGNKGSNPNPKQIKVFKDGAFASYFVNGESELKTHGGKFKVLSDSVYTENILTARNTPMIGKTYAINYKMEDGVVLNMSGTYDSPYGKVSYTETWIKIQSDLMVSTKTSNRAVTQRVSVRR